MPNQVIQMSSSRSRRVKRLTCIRYFIGVLGFGLGMLTGFLYYTNPDDWPKINWARTLKAYEKSSEVFRSLRKSFDQLQLQTLKKSETRNTSSFKELNTVNNTKPIARSDHSNIRNVSLKIVLKRNRYISMEVFPTTSQPRNLNDSVGGHDLHIKFIMELPLWLKQKDYGLEKKMNLSLEDMNLKNLNQEATIAWDNFFYGTTKGLLLEIGTMATNGKHSSSASHFFEKYANWRTIYVEGNPSLATQLAKYHPKALNVNLVICDKPKNVSFVPSGGKLGKDGFLELTPNRGKLKNKTKISRRKNEQIRQVQCLPLVNIPLSNVFLPLGISHINFFTLDAQGGEFDILKSIDFTKILFDVISIAKKEVSEVNADSVREFLTFVGYVHWNSTLGRNSWFVHPNFKPFKKPDIITGLNINDLD